MPKKKTTKKHRRHGLSKKVQSASTTRLNDLLRRGLSRTGFRGSDKIRNRAIFGRLRGSFTAPKLKSVTMLLRDFVLPL